MTATEKISKILRVDKDVIKDFERKAEALTNKKNVIDKIIEENEALIKKRLQLKDFSGLYAEDIYHALVEKIKEDDLQLFKALGKPSFGLQEDVETVLSKVKEILASEFGDKPKGFFIKRDKAIEFLKKEPPGKVINYLRYHSVEELVSQEDVYEIYAAIRLFEDRDWMNQVFLKQYVSLTPEDFEEREIVFKTLNQKWVGIAQTFLAKKYQNISHLKELGVIFVVPTELGRPGETTRMFSLALHYFNEVKFYSDLFREFARESGTFAEKIANVVRVIAFDEKLPKTDKLRFLVHPRYLARYDENDWRLFEPHVSPEVLFWIRAEEAMQVLNKVFKDVHVDFSFWQNLDFVGDYFKTAIGIDVLVSFNFVDTMMAFLVKERELTKYLYHHQEAMWNKIFREYFGVEKMETLMKENLIRGYFEL